MAETGADPSMAIIKLKTRGFGSGSPVSALMLSLSLNVAESTSLGFVVNQKIGQRDLISERPVTSESNCSD